MVAAAVFAVFLLIYYIFSQYYLFETDAYVESHIVTVSPVVSGRLKTLYIKDLAPVKKGQILFEIDPTPFIAQQHLAQANLQQARDKYHSLLAQKASAIALIKKARANLLFQQQELKRYQRLSAEDLSSQEKKDQTQTALEQSQSELLMAKANLQNLNALLGRSQKDFAPIERAKAALNLANYNLHHTKYRSTVNGYITSMLLREGDYLTAGQPLFALIDESQWWVLLKAKENYLASMTQNNPVTIWLPSNPGIAFKGYVYGTAWGVNRKENSSTAAKSILPYIKQTEHWIQLAQRFPVRILFDPKGQKLRSGANARVLVKLN